MQPAHRRQPLPPLVTLLLLTLALAATACSAADEAEGGEDASAADAVAADAGGAVGEDAAGGSPDAAAGDDGGVADGSGPCAAPGDPCDDGDPCTTDDACVEGGGCAGAPKVCDDGLACTVDSCASDSGECVHEASGGACVVAGLCVDDGASPEGAPCQACNAGALEPVAGATCDDGDPCTEDDVCDDAGACAGAGKLCTDDNPCTFDSCVPGQGCLYEEVAAACQDGDPCSLGDQCKDGACQPGTQQQVCDDGDPCTDDLCEAGTGCVSTAKACDDGKPCTMDACEAGSGCVHTDMAPGDACSNGDACVVGETCSQNLLCVGGSPKDCTDGNVCTDDDCDKTDGCANPFNSAGCDDGFACTIDDTCAAGECIGNKTTSCAQCNKTFGPTAAKLVLFQVGKDGSPGEGIDVDADPTTCAPEPGCSAGVDNALGGIAGFLNPTLDGSVKDGTLSFVAEFEDYDGEGKPFTLNLYYAELTAEAKAAGCNPLGEVCAFLADQSAFAADCKPKFSFPDAVINGGKLVAGGPNNIFAMDANLVGASSGALVVKGARIEGTVVFAADGKTVTGVKGVLGGAVPQQSLIDVINALPTSAFPIPKDQLLQLVFTLVPVDQDIDGNGVPDGSSIGLRFDAIGAVIAGTEQ